MIFKPPLLLPSLFSLSSNNRIRALSSSIPNYGIPSPSKFASKVHDPHFDSMCDNVEAWVIFSDLHVSRRTLSVCEKVLEEVQSVARERNAGVLMLGDFWHHRGVLPVETLNRIISILRPWDIPMLMIPGNHDQVDISGLSHALAPLAAACPNIHVFDEPIAYKNAVFLPYRRDPCTLKTVLRKLVDETTKGIFIHADVVGAIMNGNTKAREGLDPGTLPAGIPVFSGHYHKPHTVEGTDIQYVGSPYEVTLAERGQNKHLVILNTEWQEVDKVPLDIGPKHYKINGVNPEIPEKLRKGDKLRWEIVAGDEIKIREMEKSIRRKGVQVVVSSLQSTSAPRIQEPEALTPTEVLRKYAKGNHMSSKGLEIGISILQGLGINSPQRSSMATTINLDLVEIEGFGPFRDKVEYQLSSEGVRVICGDNMDDPNSQSNGAGKSMLVVAPLWAITGRIDVRGEMSGRMLNADLVHDKATSASVRVSGEVNGDGFVIERMVKKNKTSGSLAFELNGVNISKADARLTQKEINETLSSVMLASSAFYGHGNVTSLLDANDTAFKEQLGKVVDLEIWQVAKAESNEKLKEASGALMKETTIRYNVEDNLKTFRENLRKEEYASKSWKKGKEVNMQNTKEKLDNCERELKFWVSKADRLSSYIKAWIQWASSSEVSQGLLSKNMLGSEHYCDEGVSDLHESNDDEDPLKQPIDAVSVVEDNTIQKFLGSPVSPESSIGVHAMIKSLQMSKTDLETRLDEAQGNANVLKGKFDEKKGKMKLYISINDKASRAGPLICTTCLQAIDHETYDRNLQFFQVEVSQAKEDCINAKERCSELALKCGDVSKKLEREETAMKKKENERRQKKKQEKEAQAEEEKRNYIEKEKKLKEEEMKVMGDITRMQALTENLDASIEKVQQLVQPDHDYGVHEMDGGDFVPPTGSVQDEFKKIEGKLVEVPGAIQRIEELRETLYMSRQELKLKKGEIDPHETAQQSFQTMIVGEEAKLEIAKKEISSLESTVKALTELYNSFGNNGIPSFITESALVDLEIQTAEFMNRLSPGTTMQLKSTKKETSKRDGPAAEKIEKVFTTSTHDGEKVARSLQQFSSGEVRRMALALSLGFSTLLAKRNKLRCNLIVFDEALGQLDREGCEAMAEVLETLPQSTVLVVGQAGSFATQAFDVVDLVVKSGGSSTIRLSTKSP